MAEDRPIDMFLAMPQGISIFHTEHNMFRHFSIQIRRTLKSKDFLFFSDLNCLFCINGMENATWTLVLLTIADNYSVYEKILEAIWMVLKAFVFKRVEKMMIIQLNSSTLKSISKPGQNFVEWSKLVVLKYFDQPVNPRYRHSLA